MFMTRRSRRRAIDGSASGQSLVEFALVAPIFFLMVFAVIQLGMVFSAQDGLVDGVRTAARRAATYRINEASFDASVWPAICQAIKDEISARLHDRVIGYNAARLTRTIAYEWKQNPESGDYFLVAHIAATYQNQLYVPLVAAFLDRTDGTVDNYITLTASEQMRIENPALQPSTDPPAAPPACP
jgi:Flp pilus assembly protein TadG